MKKTRAWMKAAVSTATVTAVLTAGVAACGQAEYTYVRDREGTTYFKVPSSFSKIDSTKIDLLLSGDHPESETAKLRKQLVWSTAFDQAPEPAVDHLLGSQDPFVYSTVHRLTEPQRNVVSLNTMRDFILPVTEEMRQAYTQRLMEAGQQPTLARFELLTDQPIVLSDGARGVRVRFNYLIGDTVQTFDQTAYLDRTGGTVSVLLIRCTAACFSKRVAEFDNIAESFKLLKMPG
ncbi:hypothetical protein [Nonomuraea sp. NPDC003804]|uniref:hypothetical protein n=1 Tax=Nonomuraea sp. NPDC003804 TaxID=3154547 RepID=UPI0033A4F918